MVANNLLSLDVGEKRIGVARASYHARIAEPLTTLTNDTHFIDELNRMLTDQTANRIIIGLPRNMSGQETAQTDYVRRFSDKIRRELKTVAIEFQDETLSSQQAESDLAARGKKYQRGDIDALAATVILQDYLDQHAGAAL